ncbi:MAG: Mur ligase family protein [Gaiellaceae bacterium]
MSELPVRALVVGLARSGQSAALALARRGVRVTGVDRRDLDAGRLREAGVEVRLGSEEGALAGDVDVVIKSPGVPAGAPPVAAARDRCVPVWSEVELGFRLLENPIVGVTGTNGKTTTSELLGAVFRAAGRGVAVAGNVGRPLTALDGELSSDAWIVCELSSFQLEDIERFRPRIGVLLNLEPDHLDRHEGFERYREAKLRLFENQRAGDTAVLPRGFGPVPGEAERREFDAADPLPAEPRIPGRHNRENAAAATAAARAAGLGDEAIGQALASFAGVPHRLELVRTVRGVRWVNDSKATNTAAARRALEAYAGESVRLILGGTPKGELFDTLAAQIGPSVRSVHLVGDAADELAAVLDVAGVAYRREGTLERAVATAAAEAEPGDVVLLAPACASYDQYASFEERGDHFRRLVERLP